MQYECPLNDSKQKNILCGLGINGLCYFSSGDDEFWNCDTFRNLERNRHMYEAKISQDLSGENPHNDKYMMEQVDSLIEIVFGVSPHETREVERDLSASVLNEARRLFHKLSEYATGLIADNDPVIKEIGAMEDVCTSTLNALHDEGHYEGMQLVDTETEILVAQPENQSVEV